MRRNARILLEDDSLTVGGVVSESDTDSSQTGDVEESQAPRPPQNWTREKSGRWIQHAKKEDAVRTYNAGPTEDGSQSDPNTDNSQPDLYDSSTDDPDSSDDPDPGCSGEGNPTEVPQRQKLLARKLSVNDCRGPTRGRVRLATKDQVKSRRGTRSCWADDSDPADDSSTSSDTTPDPDNRNWVQYTTKDSLSHEQAMEADARQWRELAVRQSAARLTHAYPNQSLSEEHNGPEQAMDSEFASGMEQRVEAGHGLDSWRRSQMPPGALSDPDADTSDTRLRDPRFLGGNSRVAPLLEFILTNPTPAFVKRFRCQEFQPPTRRSRQVPFRDSKARGHQYPFQQGLLDTRHHNWFIALALGMVPDNNDFRQDGNQQIRKLISTCIVIYRAMAYAHTPASAEWPSYKSAYTGLGRAHTLPMAILSNRFRSTPPGEHGCPVNLRARIDGHSRQTITDVCHGRVWLHAGHGTVGVSQLEHLRNMPQLDDDIPTAAPGVADGQLRMASAVMMTTNITLAAPGSDSALFAGLTASVGSARFEDKTGIKLRKLERSALIRGFIDYPVQCVRVLRKIGAIGCSEECLEWAVRNMNMFVIRIERKGAMKYWNKMRVSYSESSLARGTVVLLERGDGTAHIFCKMYSGSNNWMNSTEEYASTQTCTAAEVHNSVSSMLFIASGQHVGSFVTIEGQCEHIRWVCNNATVGSRSQVGSPGEHDHSSATQEATITAYTHETEGLIVRVNPPMRAGVVLHAAERDRQTARRHLLRWLVILRDICHRMDDDTVADQEYAIQYTVSGQQEKATKYLTKVDRSQALARIAFAAYCRVTLPQQEATQLMQVAWMLVHEIFGVEFGATVRSKVVFKVGRAKEFRGGIMGVHHHIVCCAGNSLNTSWTCGISDPFSEVADIYEKPARADSEFLPLVYIQLVLCSQSGLPLS